MYKIFLTEEFTSQNFSRYHSAPSAWKPNTTYRKTVVCYSSGVLIHKLRIGKSYVKASFRFYPTTSHLIFAAASRWFVRWQIENEGLQGVITSASDISCQFIADLDI